MSTLLPAIVDPVETGLPIDIATSLEELFQRSRETRRSSKAKGTLRAYASSMRSFTAWCEHHGLQALPAAPETVVLFIEAEREAGRKVSTIETKLAAIRFVHLRAGHTSPAANPLVIEEMEGLRRQLGTATTRKKAATADIVAAMLEHAPETLKGTRDRALILLGFAGAFRRSELVALDVEDLAFTSHGVEVTVRRSKTDQTGEGKVIAIPHGTSLRPVEALRAWLDATDAKVGPVFRPVAKGDRLQGARLSDRSVANLVKHYAELAGFDVDGFSGHSLRAGFITSAADGGADLSRIMEVSRHVEPRTVQGYIRRANLFRDHAGETFL